MHGLGREPPVHVLVVGNFVAIHRGHLGAAAFGFKAEPAIPGTDIEHALAAEDGRNREPRPTRLLPLQAHAAFDDAAVRQLEAVVPALSGEFRDKVVLPPAKFARAFLVRHEKNQLNSPGT